VAQIGKICKISNQAVGLTRWIRTGQSNDISIGCNCANSFTLSKYFSLSLTFASAARRDTAIILKLSIECVRGYYLKEPCIRVIEINDDANLYALHEAIQDAVDFERDHPFGFYIANSSSQWAQKHWIRRDEEWKRMET